MIYEIDKEYKKVSEELAWQSRFFKNSNRALKVALLKHNPFCYWCKVAVFDYGKVPDGEKHKSDEATIDHLVSRFTRKKYESVPKVLCCHACNAKRNHEEIKAKL